MSNEKQGQGPRPGGRSENEIRTVSMEPSPLDYAEGSALIHCGRTRVLAAASVERRVPPFLYDSGTGWVTGEYAMLPRATHTRNQRESARGKISGRTSEIQRLIGRSLRAVVDRSKMPDRTVTVDCDVLQADGGTRTASITAGYVALVQALGKTFLEGDIDEWPIIDSVAAVSVGLVDDVPLLDLEYVEDSNAQVDLNVVATGNGEIVEVQGTGEQRGFTRSELSALMDLAEIGLAELRRAQQEVLGPVLAAVEERRSGGGGSRKVEPKPIESLWGPPKD